MLAASFLAGAAGITRADILDEHSRLQIQLDTGLLDLHGGRWQQADWSAWHARLEAFARVLKDQEAQRFLREVLSREPDDPLSLAEMFGRIRATVQHVAAREMLRAHHDGDLETAREWRAVIMLPKYANSVDGALALQRLGGDNRHRDEVAKLLAREYVIWQITRAREKADNLERLLSSGRATPGLIVARAAEVEELRHVPDSVMSLAADGESSRPQSPESVDGIPFGALLIAVREKPSESWVEAVHAWRLAVESGFPNLLSAEDVKRRELVILKLLRLIPMEYRAGVRDGQVTIPIEYREAKSFNLQAQQIVSELIPAWRQTRAEAVRAHGPALLAALDGLERQIDAKTAVEQIEAHVKRAVSLLQDEFGLEARRAGRASDVVAETELETRALLGQSLAAAQSGQWRKAEALRLDAYIHFDLEIESRTLPRDPSLALRVERAFLDGTSDQAGIKAVLDRRATDDELSAAYQRALDGLAECTALLKVGLSPGAAIVGTLIVVLREGLEAVVILAALLAGLRGVENAPVRKRLALGAWLALAASGVLFVLSQHALAGMSRYGENLEAVISIVAVIVLLMVTNWVFHKFYWTGWNAKLRELSRAAQNPGNRRFESLALIGVGFTTIFREGFETTLFLQSLILEAGLRSILIGLGIGAVCIGTLGYAVFWIGARLPYRRMLIFTGILVASVLFTFLGSTTRLFQTVGWLPVHPVPGLDLPIWMGVWLGLYPTWEGLLIPMATFPYLAGMWILNRFLARRSPQRAGGSSVEEAGSTTLRRI